MSTEDAIAVEIRTLREITERNHKETTEQIGKLVSSERHELVTKSLVEEDARNATAIKEVADDLARSIAAQEQNAKQIRTLWLTFVTGLVGAVAAGLIIARVTGTWV